MVLNVHFSSSVISEFNIGNGWSMLKAIINLMIKI